MTSALPSRTCRSRSPPPASKSGFQTHLSCALLGQTRMHFPNPHTTCSQAVARHTAAHHHSGKRRRRVSRRWNLLCAPVEAVLTPNPSSKQLHSCRDLHHPFPKLARDIPAFHTSANPERVLPNHLSEVYRSVSVAQWMLADLLTL